MEHHDIAVIGAGLAGGLCALALADAGYCVALVAPVSSGADGRTTALMDQSIGFVEALGLWPSVAPLSAALSSMRIIDGTTRLLRAPTVTFHAAEVGLDAFGYNIPNAPFLAILEAATRAHPRITRIEKSFRALSCEEGAAIITMDDGDCLSAGLVVGADGRRSPVRDASKIDVHLWAYPQAAMVLNFTHTLPHQNISTEFHTEDGPFTQVPLPGNRSSLVWVRKPDVAAKTAALPLEALSLAVENRMQSLLGKVTIDTPPQAFPLSGMMASRFGKGRIVLIGEAAHAFPPIGAQGLNLSLRDIMALVSLLGPAGVDGIPADIGNRHDRSRRPDILSRTASVDLLNRSLLSGFLPVQMLRAAGLQILSSAAPLRNLMMREGIAPGSALQSLRRNLREKIGRKQA